MNYHQAVFETAFGTPSQLPPSELPELVFAGRSNVGKSSLINKLFNQKSLARVSATPGKTATINFYRAGGLRFADLPGYGYAKVSRGEKRRWADLIEGYLTQDRDIALVFSLMDFRHPPSRDDLHMVDFLIGQELPCADQITVIPFSAVTGEGVAEIRSIIEELEDEPADGEDPGEAAPQEGE